MHNLEWQMVYGSINIGERFLPIERLISKVKSKWESKGRMKTKSILFSYIAWTCIVSRIAYVRYPVLYLSLPLSISIAAQLVSMGLWQVTMIYCGPIYNQTIFSLSFHVCIAFFLCIQPSIWHSHCPIPVRLRVCVCVRATDERHDYW